MSDMAMTVLYTPSDVVEFWFGSLDFSEISSLDAIQKRFGVWFGSKSPEFDNVQIENSNLISIAAESAFEDSWSTSTGILARIILLDQFPRCVYRGTSQAFRYDQITASLVKEIYDSDKLVSDYAPIHRFFLGVAIQHSEDIAMQKIGVEIAKKVSIGAPDDVRDFFSNLKGYPHEHYDVIARFGRFPSRNVAMGRDSTPEEIAWMKSPECPAWAKSQIPKKVKPLPAAIVNVGIVAFGLSGRVFHAPFLLTNPHFNLVAVYERSNNEANAFASRHGITVDTVRSLEDLLFRADIQLIVICSPIEFHYSQARQALAAGKHVLVEKAFCSNSEEALDLLTFAREKNLVCMPYQNRRYDSDFLTLQRLVHEGCMGEIVEYNGYFNRYSPYVRKGAWKDTTVGSGGNFLSLGSHMIDQAVILFGAPSRVWADIRCQRDGGVLDDAWEVHLFYDTKVVRGDDEEEDTSPNPDSQGLHKGGFRAILKGSLLCVDHGLRYMVHGKNGSWIKHGMDTQEAYLMLGKLPFYRLRATSYDDEDYDEDGGEESANYGIESTAQWGQLSVAGQNTVSTPAELGSYHLLYDELYHRISSPTSSTSDVDMVPVVVLRIIELAKLSSLRGQVLSMDTSGL